MPRVLKKDKVWQPPPVGTKARQQIPEWGFLIPEERKYPFIKYQDGKWVVSCSGLLAAYRRALMNKDSVIANKAKNKAKQYGCKWAKNSE